LRETSWSIFPTTTTPIPSVYTSLFVKEKKEKQKNVDLLKCVAIDRIHRGNNVSRSP
jgi:hypothetical protein